MARTETTVQGCPSATPTTCPQRRQRVGVQGPSIKTREKGGPERLNDLPKVMGFWQNQREERGGRAREGRWKERKGGRKRGGAAGSLHISPGGSEACQLLTFLRAPMAITPWPRHAPSLATPMALPPPNRLVVDIDPQSAGSKERASPILFF